MNKSIFLSKTFWVQVCAVLSMMFPPVLAWLKANPVEFVMFLAAVNVVIRFVTSGKVSLTDDDSSAGGTSVWLVFAWIAGTASVGTLLPSCSLPQIQALGKLPIKATLVTEQGRLSYSAKSGLEVAVDQTGDK